MKINKLNNSMSMNKNLMMYSSIFSMIISGIFTIIINSIIIYLMTRLRDISCNCIVDWRNDFIITYSSIIMAFAIFRPFYVTLMPTTKLNLNIMNIFSIVLSIAMIINVYCLYSYTKDLEESKCSCAMGRDNKEFGFVYYLIRITLLFVLITLIISILLSLFLSS